MISQADKWSERELWESIINDDIQQATLNMLKNSVTSGL